MGAKLPDISTLIQAGIDPKSGLPIKAGCKGFNRPQLKENIKKALRVLDEQNAVNRYKWYNLPDGLDSQLLERILYYKWKGMFFYLEETDKFYFLPYTLDGTIDVYGRFTGVTPLPFNGGTTAETKDGKNKLLPWVPGLVRKPIYNVMEEEELLNEFGENVFTKSCVLLNDYTKQMSETDIPRQIIQDPILDAMAEAFPFARTSLIANSGVRGMRVTDEDTGAQVEYASEAMMQACLDGKPLIPIVSTIEIQDLTDGNALKSEEYLLYLQALDNFRLSLYGLDNGGLFQKKAHMLEAEQEMNNGNIGPIMQDGQRKYIISTSRRTYQQTKIL